MNIKLSVKLSVKCSTDVHTFLKKQMHSMKLYHSVYTRGRRRKPWDTTRSLRKMPTIHGIWTTNRKVLDGYVPFLTEVTWVLLGHDEMMFFFLIFLNKSFEQHVCVCESKSHHVAASLFFKTGETVM